jgi:predicted nucleic acid-binding Zn ribbon protein
MRTGRRASKPHQIANRIQLYSNLGIRTRVEGHGQRYVFEAKARLRRSDLRAAASAIAAPSTCRRSGGCPGRPAGRTRRSGAAMRSSARSGDSGDGSGDAEPSGHPGRHCLSCGIDISHRRADARTCGATCRRRLADRRPQPDRPVKLMVDGAIAALLTPFQAERLLSATIGLRRCLDHSAVHLESEGCWHCQEMLTVLLETNGVACNGFTQKTTRSLPGERVDKEAGSSGRAPTQLRS